MNNNASNEDNDNSGLYALYLCILEDIGVKRFSEIQKKYFNNKFNSENEAELNRFIEIAINYEI